MSSRILFFSDKLHLFDDVLTYLFFFSISGRSIFLKSHFDCLHFTYSLLDLCRSQGSPEFQYPFCPCCFAVASPGAFLRKTSVFDSFFGETSHSLLCKKPLRPTNWCCAPTAILAITSKIYLSITSSYINLCLHICVLSLNSAQVLHTASA